MDEAVTTKKKIYCWSCGVDCTRIRFHNSKATASRPGGQAPITDQKYDVCPNCFINGRFPEGHSSGDFVKLEDPHYTNIPDKTAPWTESETLLLLEAMEQFDEDWKRISEHVGTRTREECVVKFLNLPIEDQYLEREADFASATIRSLSGRTPITQEDNPILSVVSYLAQTVDQTTAAAAAGKTVAAMRSELQKQINKKAGTSEKAKEPVKNEEPADDSMEVDAGASTDLVVVDRPESTPQQGNFGLMVSSLGAAKAAALISHEERVNISLISTGTNLVLSKAELKDTQLVAMEEALEAERRDVERVRQDLYIERMALKARIEEVEKELRTALTLGAQEGINAVQGIHANTLGTRFGADGAADDVKPVAEQGQTVDF